MPNQRILIVDDDPDVLQGMRVRLGANQYDTFFASDASTAVAKARTCKPDLVILDLGLPAGGGFFVIESLKAIPSLAVVPIIVVSARDAAANERLARKAGAHAFLQKPVDDAQLLAVIRQSLGRQSAWPPIEDRGSIRFQS
ncbi:MAG TPA: response regulator transcription factor [Terriglobales bacterium]|nr:response regulator transcription factor [Terriglobales bacterium]